MTPDLATVLRWRAAARAWLRLGALLAAPASLFFLGAWLIEGLHDGDLWNLRYYYWRVLSGALFGLWSIVGLTLPGLIARIILRLPRGKWPPRCPYCRHDLVSLKEMRCPECGNALTDEFVRASNNRPGGGS